MADFENPFDDASFDDSVPDAHTPLTGSYAGTKTSFFDTKPAPAPAPAIPPKPSTPPTATATATAQPPPPPPVDRRAKEIEMRLSELERREKELNEREAELNRREQDMEARKLASESGGSGAAAAASMAPIDPHAPNWPRWPKPLVYQNFNEVPSGLRRLVRCVYFNWMAGEVILLYNLVCSLAVVFSGEASAMGDVILAAIYVVGWSFLSFFIYRRLYKASISGKSLKYFMFFAGFAVQIVFDGFGVVGIRGSGFMGVFWTIKAFGDNGFAGFMCLACALLWGLTMAFCIYVWIHVRVVYKKAGGLTATKKEASKAATEKAVGFAKENPDVFIDVASTGVKAAAASSSSNNKK